MSRTNLGKRIRQAREQKGYTIESFAHALGVSWITVSRYERGKGGIPLDRLDEIAALLDTKASDLLDGIEVAA